MDYKNVDYKYKLQTMLTNIKQFSFHLSKVTSESQLFWFILYLSKVDLGGKSLSDKEKVK